MDALRYFLLFLGKLFQVLRNPLDQSLWRLLRVWALVKTRIFSWEAHGKSTKPVRQSERTDQGSTIICASEVPTRSFQMVAGNTPTQATPIPRVVVSPHNESIGPSENPSGGNCGAEDHTHNHSNSCGIFLDLPQVPSRVSSRAPSIASYRNSHMGAEESVLRSTARPHFVMPSRSGSPVPKRSIQSPKTYLEPDHIHLHRLRDNTANPRAHSIDMSYQIPDYGLPSRAPSPSAGFGNSGHQIDTQKLDVSPIHVTADLEPIVSRPCSTMLGTPKIRPCTTVGRYDRNVKINLDVDENFVIPSMTTTFTHNNQPVDWTLLAHPEGAPYWFHEDPPVYTDAYLCHEETLAEIKEFLGTIMLHIDPPRMPRDWELVLELTRDKETNEHIWAYYFVDHDARALFWLQDFKADMILSELRGVKSKSHIYHQLQSYYWTHWETFPHNREVPLALYQELMGILVHAGIDSLTSPVSTSVYSEVDLQKLIGFIKMSQSIGGNYGYAACVTGRMMSFFANSRFLNFYGQECARLSRDQPVLGEEPRPRSALMLLSALLFFAPEVHLRDIYVDWIVCAHMWSTFIGKLQGEWQEFILYATVLLNANVAFLAIPSVDNGISNRTPSQIVSYISVVTSIGSITTGLLLIRQHRNKMESAPEIDEFLRRRTHATHGLETLAIMYSLPYSLLMWAMTTFLTAFLLECLFKPADVLARVPVIISWASVGELVLWCISTGWERKHPVRYPLRELVRSWMRPFQAARIC